MVTNPATGLSTRQERAAELLTGGQKHRQVAEALDMSVRQLGRWRAKSEFISYMDTLHPRAARIGELRDEVYAEALTTLKKCLEATSLETQLAACRIALDFLSYPNSSGAAEDDGSETAPEGTTAGQHIIPRAS